MRSLKAIVFLILITLFLAGCSENPGTTTMKLVLKTGRATGERTLLPEDSTALDVSCYTVSGVGPNGKRFTKSSDSSSVEVEGLAINHFIQKN